MTGKKTTSCCPPMSLCLEQFVNVDEDLAYAHVSPRLPQPLAAVDIDTELTGATSKVWNCEVQTRMIHEACSECGTAAASFQIMRTRPT